MFGRTAGDASEEYAVSDNAQQPKARGFSKPTGLTAWPPAGRPHTDAAFGGQRMMPPNLHAGSHGTSLPSFDDPSQNLTARTPASGRPSTAYREAAAGHSSFLQYAGDIASGRGSLHEWSDVTREICNGFREELHTGILQLRHDLADAVSHVVAEIRGSLGVESSHIQETLQHLLSSSRAADGSREMPDNPRKVSVGSNKPLMEAVESCRAIGCQILEAIDTMSSDIRSQAGRRASGRAINDSSSELVGIQQVDQRLEALQHKIAENGRSTTAIINSSKSGFSEVTEGIADTHSSLLAAMDANQRSLHATMKTTRAELFAHILEILELVREVNMEPGLSSLHARLDDRHNSLIEVLQAGRLDRSAMQQMQSSMDQNHSELLHALREGVADIGLKLTSVGRGADANYQKLSSALEFSTSRDPSVLHVTQSIEKRIMQLEATKFNDTYGQQIMQVTRGIEQKLVDLEAAQLNDKYGHPILQVTRSIEQRLIDMEASQSRGECGQVRHTPFHDAAERCQELDQVKVDQSAVNTALRRFEEQAMRLPTLPAEEKMGRTNGQGSQLHPSNQQRQHQLLPLMFDIDAKQAQVVESLPIICGIDAKQSQVLQALSKVEDVVNKTQGYLAAAIIGESEARFSPLHAAIEKWQEENSKWGVAHAAQLNDILNESKGLHEVLDNIRVNVPVLQTEQRFSLQDVVDVDDAVGRGLAMGATHIISQTVAMGQESPTSPQKAVRFADDTGSAVTLDMLRTDGEKVRDAVHAVHKDLHLLKEKLAVPSRVADQSPQEALDADNSAIWEAIAADSQDMKDRITEINKNVASLMELDFEASQAPLLEAIASLSSQVSRQQESIIDVSKAAKDQTPVLDAIASLSSQVSCQQAAISDGSRHAKDQAPLLEAIATLTSRVSLQQAAISDGSKNAKEQAPLLEAMASLSSQLSNQQVAISDGSREARDQASLLDAIRSLGSQVSRQQSEIGESHMAKLSDILEQHQQVASENFENQTRTISAVLGSIKDNVIDSVAELSMGPTGSPGGVDPGAATQNELHELKAGVGTIVGMLQKSKAVQAKERQSFAVVTSTLQALQQKVESNGVAMESLKDGLQAVASAEVQARRSGRAKTVDLSKKRESTAYRPETEEIQRRKARARTVDLVDLRDAHQDDIQHSMDVARGHSVRRDSLASAASDLNDVDGSDSAFSEGAFTPGGRPRTSF